MNAKNASGNTPLHVCAVDNQEACARLLLFRGADREALNYANQTPYQVAVIAGNLELASLIHRFRSDDVGKLTDSQTHRLLCPSVIKKAIVLKRYTHSFFTVISFTVAFKETPSYNPRRRKSIMSMRHSVSSSVLDGSSIASSSTTGSSSTPSPTLVYSSLASRTISRRQQPSPSPSNTDRWLELNPLCMSTVSVRSDTGSSSSCTAESEDNASANGSSLTGNELSCRLTLRAHD